MTRRLAGLMKPNDKIAALIFWSFVSGVLIFVSHDMTKLSCRDDLLVGPLVRYTLLFSIMWNIDLKLVILTFFVFCFLHLPFFWLCFENYRLRVPLHSEKGTTSPTLPAVVAERSPSTSKSLLARLADTLARK